MRFTSLSSLLIAVAAAATLVAAQNPISNPASANTLIPAGAPYTITWTHTTAGPITINLLAGPTNITLQQKLIVADSIANSGSFTWNVPTDLSSTDVYGFSLIDIPTKVLQYSFPFNITGGSSSSTNGSVSASGSASSSASYATSNSTIYSSATSTTSSVDTTTLSDTSAPTSLITLVNDTSASTLPTPTGAQATGSSTGSAALASSTSSASPRIIGDSVLAVVALIAASWVM